MRRVLIIESDRESVDRISNSIIKDGYIIQAAQDDHAALHRLRAWKPHLILLNFKIAQVGQFEIFQKIRAATTDEYTAIVVMGEKLTVDEVKKCFDSGADDFLLLPAEDFQIHFRLQCMVKLKEIQDSLKRAHHRIEELSSTDDLTGLMNMRAIYRKGDEEIVRSKRFRKPMSALLLNLNSFSSVNHNYGFPVGSRVLQEVANRLKECVRSIDWVARVGADEFFVLLSETDLAGAEFMAERIKDAIQSTPFKKDQESIRLTACLGVAGISPDHPEQQADLKMSDLLHITTEALRSAKENGPNRIEIYSL